MTASALAPDGAEETPKRVALVTGGSRGIGAAIVTRLAADGRAVAIGHRGGDAADELATAINAGGGIAVPVRLDVTDQASIIDAVAEVEDRLGRPTILVNNAGVTADGLFLRMDDERWRIPFDTNLDGTFRVTRAVLRPMLRERWGRIVNLSSVVALTGSAGQVNYAAAKAAIIGLTRSLAREVADRSITVNAVAPGPIDTDMLGAVGTDRTDALAEATPAGRLGDPAEVAAAVSFLTAEDAGYVTGAVIPVDGGLGLGH